MKFEQCTCFGKYHESHRCPYRDDIYNEYELDDDQVTLCNCCDYCTYQCAMDI